MSEVSCQFSDGRHDDHLITTTLPKASNKPSGRSQF